MATVTPKELAVEFDSDPRTVRKFLRSDAGKATRVGKGSRWAIERREVRSLRKSFDRWIEAKAPVADEVPEGDEVLDEVIEEIVLDES